MGPSNQKHQPVKGIFFFVTAIFLISVVDTICKFFTKDLHAIQIVWGYLIGINVTLWLFFFLKGEKISKLVITEKLLLQIIRPAFLICSISSLFLGLTYLPIAEATAIGFVAPLFITALSVPILRETVGIHRWFAVMIGFLGVLIIVRPGSEFWQLASLMPLLGAFFFALFQIMTRLLSATENTYTTLFYTGLAGLGWSSLMVPFVWVPMFEIHFYVFFSIGIMGAIAHLCMISAFDKADASFLAPYNYTKLLWVTFFGYFIFGDIPSFEMWIGAFIIVSAGFYVFNREKRKIV